MKGRLPMNRYTISVVTAMVIPACITLAAPKQEKHAKPPHGAIVLFNGKDTSEWKHGNGRDVQWLVADGVMEVKPGSGNVVTKRAFGDYKLHLEFATPLMPEAKSQARGNSGVYQQAQ